MSEEEKEARQAFNRIRRDWGFWAPEYRVERLLMFLNQYGEPLYKILDSELTAEEKAAFHFDKIRKPSKEKANGGS